MSNSYIPDTWFITALVIGGIVIAALLVALLIQSNSHRNTVSKLMHALDMARDAAADAINARDHARRVFEQWDKHVKQRDEAEFTRRLTIDDIMAGERMEALQEVERYVKGYVDEYELEADGASYKPTEQERQLLLDSFHGILADSYFLQLFGAWQAKCVWFYDGADLIRLERHRQKVKEGYTAVHDNGHLCTDFIAAAMAYLQHARGGPGPQMLWPWANGYKPGTTARDLVKAGALIAAGLDRMQTRIPATHEPEHA